MAPCWEEAKGCLHGREDGVLRRDAQEGEEERRESEHAGGRAEKGWVEELGRRTDAKLLYLRAVLRRRGKKAALRCPYF